MIRPDLLMLAGSALNAAAVPPGAGADGAGAPRAAVLELRSRGRAVRLPAEPYRAADGRWGVRATAALVGPGAPAVPLPPDLPAVRLEEGAWRVRLVVAGRLRDRAFDLRGGADARPSAAPGLALVAGRGGRAEVRVAAPAPAAQVEHVRVRPHGVRVEGVLTGIGDGGGPACRLRARRHGTELPVHPELRPGPLGTEFALDLPLTRMAEAAGSSGAEGAEVRWGLFFRSAPDADLVAGLPRTDLADPRSALRVPDATVRPGDPGRPCPPLRVRVFHDGPRPDGGTALVVGVRPLPESPLPRPPMPDTPPPGGSA
ncbi:hypothetical protein O4J56_06570 [Nocardiopsis sp. RSe5-2]|uniref:Uncharacterized protein n=1 Tax=Nocardiopsis endophytica TaxID=3018445 RepID=A0ABT4U020_9ACTN|nr:hypothetical protein [Nocardiopsis endophytica]MDA2810298.1 hypothetical protein [Nocardiopsis endophytica]